MDSPSWTDITQAMAACVSVPAAIVGFIYFFRKDKDKEKQIQKLSEVVNHLSKMVDQSEKRYVETRKPILKITATRTEEQKIHLQFENWNLHSLIQSYSIVNKDPNSVIKWVSTSNEKLQEFAVEFDSNLGSGGDGGDMLRMNYETTEDYKFRQDIYLFSKMGELTVFQNPIKIKLDNPQ